jgi:2-methylisocitrate lyase-like PEP mutase family enzyme
MNQNDKAKAFAALHRKGDPVILYNIWDAGSAAAVTEAGAKALATGSWSVAAANGFADGEKLPRDVLVSVAKSIAAATALPVTIDFEGAYANDPATAAANVALVCDAGAVGINFEDQVVGGAGLHAIEAQAARIAAIRAMADARGLAFFINARTDLFLKEKDLSRHSGLVGEALARADAYAKAGASGLFVPGLADPELIRAVCASTTLPVNIMMRAGVPDVSVLAECGVARISHGPYPYIAMMERLKEGARAAFGLPAA